MRRLLCFALSAAGCSPPAARAPELSPSAAAPRSAPPASSAPSPRAPIHVVDALAACSDAAPEVHVSVVFLGGFPPPPFTLYVEGRQAIVEEREPGADGVVGEFAVCLSETDARASTRRSHREPRRRPCRPTCRVSARRGRAPAAARRG
jgi:hypothetical protein